MLPVCHLLFRVLGTQTESPAVMDSQSYGRRGTIKDKVNKHVISFIVGDQPRTGLGVRGWVVVSEAVTKRVTFEQT